MNEGAEGDSNTNQVVEEVEEPAKVNSPNVQNSKISFKPIQYTQEEIKQKLEERKKLAEKQAKAALSLDRDS